jgi:hypothetical protein
MLNEVTIIEKTNQLLAELRENSDWAIDGKNFKQGYFKDLEYVLQDTGIIER